MQRIVREIEMENRKEEEGEEEGKEAGEGKEAHHFFDNPFFLVSLCPELPSGLWLNSSCPKAVYWLKVYGEREATCSRCLG